MFCESQKKYFFHIFYLLLFYYCYCYFFAFIQRNWYFNLHLNFKFRQRPPFLSIQMHTQNKNEIHVYNIHAKYITIVNMCKYDEIVLSKINAFVIQLNVNI